MAAQLQIDQAGLSTGTPGVSRTDGLDTGALVTLTNTGSGSTTLFTLLWVPPGDSTSVASLTATGDPKVWTFSPTPGLYGSYLIELSEDAALPSKLTERRVLAIRTPNRGLVIPALNEAGNPNASLLADGVPQIEAADNNAADYSNPAFNSAQYAAWWRALAEVITSLEDPTPLLTSSAPVDVTKAAAAVGTADRAARADHKHDVSTAAPAFLTKLPATEGSASSLARSDHKHDISTAVPGALAAGDSATEGIASSLARSDHAHSVAAGAPVDVTKAAAEEGVSAAFSRSDHKHDISTAAPVAIEPFGSSLQEGVSTSFSRADHVHTVPAATGSASGYVSQTSITDGTIWTTSADIPEGNRFQFILTGAGGGGGGGSAARATGNFTNDGARGGGGGARPPPYWWSRAYLISQLPITFTVPTGGAGGPANVRSTTGTSGSTVGGSPAATTIVGASGIIAFAGAGGGGSGGNSGSGGGCWGNAVNQNTGGLPVDLKGAGAQPDTFAFGGAPFNTRRTSSGVQTMSRHGGGGADGGGTSPPDDPTGGISQFGGGGGGGGGFVSAIGAGRGQGKEGGGHDFTKYGNTTGPTAGGGGGLPVTDSAGSPGPDGDENVAGCGGAGGAGNAVVSGNVTSHAGGAGGFPGGGGGGGGAALSGTGTVTSGAGGNGGDAQVLLTAYL